MISKIKNEFAKDIVGFNKSGAPLGERKDLDILAKDAHHDPHVRNYFQEPLPSIEELDAEIAKDFVGKAKPAAQAEKNPLAQTNKA